MPSAGSDRRASVTSGWKRSEISTVAPMNSAERATPNSPATWNIGMSQSSTSPAVTSFSSEKFSAVVQALRPVMMTPFERPVVPEV